MVYLVHSAKGSTWEEHKYIKRLNGTYYYPDSYKGGRHLPEGSSFPSKSENADESSQTDAVEIDSLQEEDIATLAMEVIRGNFGNGDVRKELLGKHYQQVQDRVNQILRGNTGSQPIASADSAKNKREKEHFNLFMISWIKLINEIPERRNQLLESILKRSTVFTQNENKGGISKWLLLESGLRMGGMPS